MVTLAPSSKPRVGDSALEKIEVKLTHLKKKKTFREGRRMGISLVGRKRQPFWMGWYFLKTLGHWATSKFQGDENCPLISRGRENRFSYWSFSLQLTLCFNIPSSLFCLFIWKTHDIANSSKIYFWHYNEVEYAFYVRKCKSPFWERKAEMFSTDLGSIAVKRVTTLES